MNPTPSITMRYMATMMFAQRFALYGNSKDRKTIAIGNTIKIADANSSSLVIGIIPPPAIISSSIPGSKNRKISPRKPVNIRATHKADSFIFTSSIMGSHPQIGDILGHLKSCIIYYF